jgi:hypothetical protein
MATLPLFNQQVIEEETDPKLQFEEPCPFRNRNKEFAGSYKVADVFEHLLTRFNPLEHLLKIKQLKVTESTVRHLRATT